MDRIERERNKENPGRDLSEYNKYIVEISSKMNQLVSGYKKSDQMEDFYSWCIRKYEDSFIMNF